VPGLGCLGEVAVQGICTKGISVTDFSAYLRFALFWEVIEVFQHFRHSSQLRVVQSIIANRQSDKSIELAIARWRGFIVDWELPFSVMGLVMFSGFSFAFRS